MRKSLKNKKILLLLVLLALGLFISSTSLATVICDGKECNLVDWPTSPLGHVGTDINPTCEMGKCKYVELSTLIKYLYEWGIALGGLAAFIALLIAGFLYITSVGNPQQMADARGRMVAALSGLVLLLASWLILNTINPQLTTFSVSLTLVEPEISFLKKCETVEDCLKDFPEEEKEKYRDSYVCEPIAIGATEKRCVFKPEAPECEEVTVTMNDNNTGATTTHEFKEHNECWKLSVGDTTDEVEFIATSSPPGCMGFVELFTRGNCSRWFGKEVFMPVAVKEFFRPNIDVDSVKFYKY